MSTNLGLAWLVALVEPKRLRSDTHRWGATVWRTTALWNIYIYIHIYIYIYISISRAETVELRTWISQRSQRQLRPNGMLPDKYLETQTGSSRRGPWSLYVHMYICRSEPQGCDFWDSILSSVRRRPPRNVSLIIPQAPCLKEPR
jgi:hypothetical protein